MFTGARLRGPDERNVAEAIVRLTLAAKQKGSCEAGPMGARSWAKASVTHCRDHAIAQVSAVTSESAAPHTTELYPNV